MTCPNSRKVIQRKLFQPAKNKGGRSGAVCGVILLFPPRDLQYTQFWIVPINHPWEKKCQQKTCFSLCAPALPWPTRVLGWCFFSRQNVQIAGVNWFILHWQKTLESDSLQDRKRKIKDWLCENTCSFLLFKNSQMLLHRIERSGLVSRCLNVDHLPFCRAFTLKTGKIGWSCPEFHKEAGQTHEKSCTIVPG